MKTEHRYVANLDTLLNTLLPAIEETVAARDLRLLFPCQLDLLLDCHKQLLEQLEDRLDPNSECYGMVGDVFRQMCSNGSGTVSIDSNFKLSHFLASLHVSRQVASVASVLSS